MGGMLLRRKAAHAVWVRISWRNTPHGDRARRILMQWHRNAATLHHNTSAAPNRNDTTLHHNTSATPPATPKRYTAVPAPRRHGSKFRRVRFVDTFRATCVAHDTAWRMKRNTYPEIITRHPQIYYVCSLIWLSDPANKKAILPRKRSNNQSVSLPTKQQQSALRIKLRIHLL